MLLLEGKAPAQALKDELKRRVSSLTAMGRTPRLAAVLVGDNAASALYLKRKARLGRELGMAVEEVVIPVAAGEAHVEHVLRKLSQRVDVDGIILEQPLPASIRKDRVTLAIAPAKDMDGATGQVRGLLTGEACGPVPATPLAVMRLLRHYAVPLTGAHVVIIGHSPVVGKPLSLLMLKEDATVTVCHKETRNLAAHTRQADILVVAAGVPGLIQGNMIGQGAVVVDVGINVVDGRTVGDVDYESAAAVAGAITPVPGGVGPLTTLTILENTVASAERTSPFNLAAAD